MIALDALKEFINAPRRHSIKLRLRQNSRRAGVYTLEARTLKEIEHDAVNIPSDQSHHEVQAISGMSQEQAQRLATRGFQPILERLMVGPSQLSVRNTSWLRVAATTYAEQLDPGFEIRLESPQLLNGPVNVTVLSFQVWKLFDIFLSGTTFYSITVMAI